MAWIPALGPVESSLSGVAHSYKTVANATGREAYLFRQPWRLSNFRSLEKKNLILSLPFLNALCRSSFTVALRLLVPLPQEHSSEWQAGASDEAVLPYDKPNATDIADLLSE